MKIRDLLFITLTIFSSFLFGQTTEILTEIGAPRTIIIEGNYLYYTDAWNNKVSRIDITQEANEPVLIASSNNSIFEPAGLAIANGTLYIAAVANDRLWKVNLNQQPFVVDDIFTGTGSATVQVLGNYLYYSKSFDGKIFKVDLNNSDVSPIAYVSGLDTPEQIIINGDFLYIAEKDKISKINITQSNPNVEVLLSIASPKGLIVKENFLYVASSDTGTIEKIDLSSTPISATTLISGLENPYGIALYNNEMYFTTSSASFNTGKISKVNLTSLGTKEFSKTEKITILPNPASSFLQIDNLKTPTDYEIIDFNGKLICNGRIENKQLINIENLNSGMYLFRLKGLFTEKIVID